MFLTLDNLHLDERDLQGAVCTCVVAAAVFRQLSSTSGMSWSMRATVAVAASHVEGCRVAGARAQPSRLHLASISAFVSPPSRFRLAFVSALSKRASCSRRRRSAYVPVLWQWPAEVCPRPLHDDCLPGSLREATASLNVRAHVITKRITNASSPVPGGVHSAR